MARTTPGARRERLEARITPEQKELFQYAASLEGRSLTDFVISSVQAAAEASIERHRIIRLSMQDSLAFAEALLHPPEPNDELRAAYARYRELTGE